MKAFYSLFSGFILLSCFAMSPLVQANEYEEISYDDLVNRLSKKKNSYHEVGSALDDIMIHAGFGIVTSVTSYRTEAGDNTRGQSGFQLSMGIDLFSPEWSAEGVFRNFGTNTSGTESRAVRETDINVIYRSLPQNNVGYRFGGGLSTRSIKISDASKGVSYNDNSPTALVLMGVDSYINRNLSVGFGFNVRSALVSYTSDRFSFEAGLRMDTYF